MNYHWSSNLNFHYLPFIEILSKGQKAGFSSLQLRSTLQGTGCCFNYLFIYLFFFSKAGWWFKYCYYSLLTATSVGPDFTYESSPFLVCSLDTYMKIGTNIARLNLHWNLNKIDHWHAIYITTSQYFCVFSGLKDPKSKTYRLDCFTLPWVIAP